MTVLCQITGKDRYYDHTTKTRHWASWWSFLRIAFTIFSAKFMKPTNHYFSPPPRDCVTLDSFTTVHILRAGSWFTPFSCVYHNRCTSSLRPPAVCLFSRARCCVWVSVPLRDRKKVVREGAQLSLDLLLPHFPHRSTSIEQLVCAGSIRLEREGRQTLSFFAHSGSHVIFTVA